MLSLGQQLVIEQFAKQIVMNVVGILKTKNIDRKSVRYEEGKRIEKSFKSGVNASGNLVRSVRFELTETNLIVYANDYIYYLIYGRKPTGSGGNGTLKDRIRGWIDEKGITPDDGISKDTLAFLISRKIHREGSAIYLYFKGQNSGLLNNILTESLIKTYNDKFTQQLNEEFATIFNEA